ncbi:protein rep [Metasolibacillus sp. FSL H7-0170]|uniref:protein rep n=1 Tax=Metasolibacillus sp. FSL H7-0170 TaxID=2921431 RepID=UPI003158A231
MIGQNPYYKNTTKTTANFIRFQGHADALKSKELDLVTFGVLGFADDIINALKAGNLLSWSLIKQIVGGAVKVGPFGAALTINQENDLEVVKDLEEGLYRKRMISYGGLLKVVHKELNLDDVDEGDLIRVDDEDSDVEEKAYSIVTFWNWQAQNYFIKRTE